MNGPGALESYDLIRFTEQLLERLVAAQEIVEKKKAGGREEAWLADAVKLLDEAKRLPDGLLERVKGLPELEDVRGEFASTLQSGFVDLLEKLLAGITFHAGPRDPVIEALFPVLKLAPLRRAPREAVEEFFAEFEKRQKKSYLVRMLSQDQFAFARPVLEQIAGQYGKWHGCFSAQAMPEAEAAPLREELTAAGKRIDLAVRQAKLLAEAALAALPGAFEEAGLAMKPRRRAGKPAQSLEEVVAAVAVAAPVQPPAPVPVPAPAPAAEAPAAVEAKPADAAAAEAAAAPAPPEGTPAPAPKKPRKKKAAAAEPAPEAPEAAK